jgi:phenylacetate-CoA ligase
MRTSLEQELAEQAKWRLLPEHRNLRGFEELVKGEFLAPEAQRARETKWLQDTLALAVSSVPYYRELFARLGLAAGDVASARDLVRLPLLSKLTLAQEGRRLCTHPLPSGERLQGYTASSGTTGRPAKVLQTVSNNMMFTYLGQRQVRWARYDPQGLQAEIRLPGQLPRKPDGSLYDIGETCSLPGWRYLGRFFETGPYCGFSVFNPVERQVEWLLERQPHYLTAYSETLEQLALATRDLPQRPRSLHGLRAISEQLTDGMRRRIAEVFEAPIHQNYGLNEIGIVAASCAAGRYHVHSEHCIVEIVDDEGQPCAPGQSGRIVVTALRNRAMPLIRYDTDDMAEVLEGPCPCGRTLPTFGKLVGRYSRIAYLPEGTLGYVGALREALEAMPAELARDLRQFQVHQFRDGRFQLRLRCVAPLPEAFRQRIGAAWESATAGRELSLEIVEVAEIPRPPSGKYQDFTSDFMPAIGGPEDEPDRKPQG